MRNQAISLLALTGLLGATPARAQVCLGLPLEAGDHGAGALVETETGHTLLAALYAGSSHAFAWSAHAGGVLEDFPGSFPGEVDPAVGAGLAWVGGQPWTCPTIGVQYVDQDPDAFSMEPRDSDRDVTIVTVGWGAGFSTLADSTRIARAIVYVVPQLRWVRSATRFGDADDVETDRELAFDLGVTITGRRLWAGGGARVRHRENNDYPLDARMIVRGGVCW